MKAVEQLIMMTRIILEGSPAPGATARSPVSAFWAAAKKEYEETGEIQGSVFLSGDKTIWISHYDLEEIQKDGT